ncbi:SHOCT domain-containing protein [Micrococcaceae bacterium Sec5.7]
MGYGYGGMEWMWPWMLIWPILVIVGLALAAFVTIRLARGGGRSIGGQPDTFDTARRILNERYARGEIDDEEYRKRRDTLQ